jgi:starch phosphorylase
VNVSIPDGWIPEFAKDGENGFIIAPAMQYTDEHDQDRQESTTLYNLIENTLLPMYYNDPQNWLRVIKHSMKDILPYFDSDRLAAEYYQKIYSPIASLAKDSAILKEKKI